MFKFCKHQLWECSRTLSDVAMGRRPADTVIRDARLVNVCTHEILDHTDVAIACGRIALVGDAAHCIGPETEGFAGWRYPLCFWLSAFWRFFGCCLTKRRYFA